jgi:methyl-accepting chemotaxis protein
LSIANRILLGFAASIILMIGMGLFGLQQIESVRTNTETIVERDVSALKLVASIRVSRQQMQAAAEGAFAEAVLRRSNADSLALWRDKAEDTRTSLEQAIGMARQYESTALSRDRAEAWGRIAATLERSRPVLESAKADNEATFRELAAGDMDGAITTRATLSGRRGAFEAEMQTAMKEMEGAIAAGRKRIDDTYETSRVSTLVGLGLALVLAVSVAVLIRNSIVGPLGGFMAFVQRVGRGDLAGQPASTGKDEIGQLGETLNEMVEGLKSLARQSREATENLNAATAEIRASTQEQAASVEEQLAAVQETAATVDEITHSGAQIGKRAQEVIATAQATAQTSNEGLRAVDETARAMDSIREQAEAVAENIVALSEKTQAIGDIIATVNDLSERSHLLALNAAIEAAAAGENGRSFAVVASEMKMLADQAKSATGQVRSILGDIQRGINASVMLTEEAVKRVAAGKERTDVTQRTITEITGRVQESVQTFQQIVASTNQQQLGIEQVMGALQNIRQASQQTAAGTRQLDEAAANLTGLSQQLLAIAERYRV